MGDRWGIRRKELPPGPPPIALGTGQEPAPIPWWKNPLYIVAIALGVVLVIPALIGGILFPTETAQTPTIERTEDVLPRVTARAEPTGGTRLRPTTTIAPAPIQGVRSAPAAAATPSCDPSYPDFCIPTGVSDLDCGSAELQGRNRFTVHSPDRHRFDGDHDGVGCES